MEKKFKNDLNPEQEKYIKEKLQEKYKDTFVKYGMDSISQAEICNMAEFLITMHPEKYAKSMGTENNYRRDENLKKIYAVVDKPKNIALLINTNEKGKVPEGEFGVYDFKKNQFEMSGKVKDQIVKHLGIGALPIEKQDEMINELFTKKLRLNELSTMDKLATMDLTNIIDEKVPKNEIKELRDKYIDGQNKENGISKEDREKIEKENNENTEKQVTIGQEKDGQDSKKQPIPNDVKNACQKMGVNRIRSFFYVNAAELDNKVEDTRTNRNGNKVLIIEVYDNKLDCNKYYGFQDERMVLYGNDSEANKAVKDVTGNVTQMGKVIKPLKPIEKQYIEYEDSQGLVIREQIDDQSDLSMQEINRYRDDMEDTLEKYSQEIYQIKNDPLLSNEQKIERIQAIDDWCDKKTTQIAQKNDISTNDDRNIDRITDENTANIQADIQEDIQKNQENDEPDAWEVPGKITRGE